LSHRSGGLFDRQAFGVFFQLELFDPGHDGAGGDDQHFPSIRAQRGDFIGETFNLIGTEPGGAGGNQAAPDFDDDAFGAL